VNCVKGDQKQVSVCVCVRERERENKERLRHNENLILAGPTFRQMIFRDIT